MTQKILAFLKRNFVSILMIVIPLAGTYYWTVEKYGIDLIVESNTPLLSIDSSLKTPVTVLYNDKSINSINALVITVKNSGNKPIDKSKFEKEISLSFTDELAAIPEIISKTPEQLDPNIELIGNSVIIDPLLLNSGDRFSLRVLLFNSKEQIVIPKIGGRVAGISNINFINRPEVEQKEKANNIITDKILKYGIPFITILMMLSGIISFFYDYNRIRKVKESLLHIKTSDYLDKRLSIPPDKMAIELNINDYNKKGIIFLIRLKIEALLKELQTYILNTCNPSLSPKNGTDILVNRGIIPQSTASAIYDILPVINKEIHNINSYINDAELEEIKKMAITIITELESILLSKKTSNNS